MSHRKISAALSTHLQSLPSLPPVAWENAEFAPVDNVLHLAENYLPATKTNVGIEDASLNEYTGIYQITIRAEKGNYKLDAHQLIDAIESHFARGTELTFEALTVRVYDVVTAPAFIADGRFNIPVSVNWRAFA